MNIKVQRACLMLAALAVLFQGPAHAQGSATGILRGVVADPNGVPFGYILVRIVHSGINGGRKYRMKTVEKEIVVRTDANGQFTVKLAPGIYDLFVSRLGSSPVAEQVKLETGKETVFDTKLKPGRFPEVVY